MHVLLAGNYDLLLRPQTVFDLNLVIDQLADLYVAGEHPLPGWIVHIDKRKTAKIANHGNGRNCKHVNHRGIVDARFTDHAGAQNVGWVGNRNFSREGARCRIRQVADRLHLAFELLLAERGNGNEGALAFVDLSDFGFGNTDAHLHRIEIQN